MILCVWRQSLRFGNRIHRLKPTECCNTLCAVPLKPTDNSLSLWCSCKQECKHAMSSSPGNGSPFTKHQRSERIYARPRCTGSRRCIPSALLDELFAAFSQDDEWSRRGVSLSLLSWGKPEEENIDIWGSLDSGWLSDLPTSNHSQVSTTGGTLMSQKLSSLGHLGQLRRSLYESCMYS